MAKENLILPATPFTTIFLLKEPKDLIGKMSY